MFSERYLTEEELRDLFNRSDADISDGDDSKLLLTEKRNSEGTESLEDTDGGALDGLLAQVISQRKKIVPQRWRSGK